MTKRVSTLYLDSAQILTVKRYNFRCKVVGWGGGGCRGGGGAGEVIIVVVKWRITQPSFHCL